MERKIGTVRWDPLSHYRMDEQKSTPHRVYIFSLSLSRRQSPSESRRRRGRIRAPMIKGLGAMTMTRLEKNQIPPSSSLHSAPVAASITHSALDY